MDFSAVLDRGKFHSSLDYQSPLEFELKNGEHGGFAPVPPVMNEKGRGPESPGLAA
jgi:hypothetical protein